MAESALSLSTVSPAPPDGALENGVAVPPPTPPVDQVERVELVAASHGPARLDGWVAAVVGGWLLLVAAVALVGLLALWPLAEHVQIVARRAAVASPPVEPTGLPRLDLWVAHPVLTADLSILLLGALAGVLGCLVHSMTRLTQAATGRKSKHVRRSEAIAFLTAPLQGGLLALFVVTALAAGLMSTGQTTAPETVNLFTVASIGALAGLFSKRMTARLATLVNATAKGAGPVVPAAQGPVAPSSAPRPSP